ncbi:hypothetical protein F5Y17DRAFT_387474 [Xylariaceae sp. FL0594]|nr:hypothetical protein F5Y17DRAFT_387474 [Xylariaceae sp. FL0594]
MPPRLKSRRDPAQATSAVAASAAEHSPSPVPDKTIRDEEVLGEDAHEETIPDETNPDAPNPQPIHDRPVSETQDEPMSVTHNEAEGFAQTDPDSAPSTRGKAETGLQTQLVPEAEAVARLVDEPEAASSTQDNTEPPAEVAVPRAFLPGYTPVTRHIPRGFLEQLAMPASSNVNDLNLKKKPKRGPVVDEIALGSQLYPVRKRSYLFGLSRQA